MFPKGDDRILEAITQDKLNTMIDFEKAEDKVKILLHILDCIKENKLPSSFIICVIDYSKLEEVWVFFHDICAKVSELKEKCDRISTGKTLENENYISIKRENYSMLVRTEKLFEDLTDALEDNYGIECCKSIPHIIDGLNNMIKEERRKAIDKHIEEDWYTP